MTLPGVPGVPSVPEASLVSPMSLAFPGIFGVLGVPGDVPGVPGVLVSLAPLPLTIPNVGVVVSFALLKVSWKDTCWHFVFPLVGVSLFRRVAFCTYVGGCEPVPEMGILY